MSGPQTKSIYNKSNRAYSVVVLSLSCFQLFGTPRTVASRAPLSMVFPRQEYWSGLPFLSLEALLDPGIEPSQVSYIGRLILYRWEAGAYSNYF